MTLNELCQESHARAKEAGWWEAGKVKTPLECHMLIVSEVAEATEEVRNKKGAFYISGNAGESTAIIPTDAEAIADLMENWTSPSMNEAQRLATCKPEGEATELADAVIRIADWFGRHGWDLEAVVKAKMAYNQTRGYRHGGKAA